VRRALGTLRVDIACVRTSQRRDRKVLATARPVRRFTAGQVAGVAWRRSPGSRQQAAALIARASSAG